MNNVFKRNKIPIDINIIELQCLSKKYWKVMLVKIIRSMKREAHQEKQVFELDKVITSKLLYMKKITIELDIPDWADEQEVKDKDKSLAYSLTYIPVDYMRKIKR